MWLTMDFIIYVHIINYINKTNINFLLWIFSHIRIFEILRLWSFNIILTNFKSITAGECTHLFIVCDFSQRIWNGILRWIGVITVQHCELACIPLHIQFGFYFQGRRFKKVRFLIWMRWCCKYVQRVSWTWFHYKCSLASGLPFANWCNNVMD